MRFKHIILLSLPFILSACGGQDEPPVEHTHGAPIEFSSSATSRANSPLPTSYHMWASAIYHGENNDNRYYMDEAPVSYDNVGNKWCCNGYFYPLSGHMDLVAIASDGETKPNFTYTPSSDSFNPAKYSLGKSFTTFIYNTPATPSVQGNDIMVSDVAKSIGCSTSTPTVPLTFKRLMANLRITTIAGTAEAEKLLMVTGISLQYVKNDGNIKISVNNMGETYLYPWTLTGKLKTLHLKGLSIRPKQDVNAPREPIDFFLPPQKLGEAKIHIYVKLRYSEDDDWANSETIIRGTKIASSDDDEWLIGNRYIYNYTIEMLPSWQLRIKLTDETTGAILDEWVTETISVNLP